MRQWGGTGVIGLERKGSFLKPCVSVSLRRSETPHWRVRNHFYAITVNVELGSSFFLNKLDSSRTVSMMAV